MSRRATRWFATVFFLVFAAVVTWPGYLPFNRIRPLILGLPLSLVWPALWIVLGAVVLWMLDRSESRAEDEEAGR